MKCPKCDADMLRLRDVESETMTVRPFRCLDCGAVDSEVIHDDTAEPAPVQGEPE